jgi:hypothetical protein
MGFLPDRLRPAKTPADSAPPASGKKKDGYDGPSAGYGGAKSGYDGVKSGYDGPRGSQDPSRRRYDGPETGLDGPDSARGKVKPLPPGRR